MWIPKLAWFAAIALLYGCVMATSDAARCVPSTPMIAAAPAPLPQFPPRRGRGGPPNLKPQLPGLLLDWRTAVAGHDAGVQDEAVKEVSTWRYDVLSYVVTRVCQLSVSLAKSRVPADKQAAQELLGLTREEASQRNPNRVLKRGALLLTDVALFQPERRAAYFAQGSQVLVEDGRPIGQQIGSFYWELARRLMGAIQPTPASDDMVRQWYVAIAADMQRRRQWGDALTHLNQALKILPRDAVLSFFSGTVHEFLAGPIIQNVIVTAPNSMLDVGSRERELRLAQFYFQQAVDADHDLAEARLRLGRTAGLLNNHAKALAELHAAAEARMEILLQYYAALFLGREHESHGEYADARMQYESAARLYPTAQTPLLALDYLLRWSPEYPRFFEALEQILKSGEGDLLPQDPWWYYDVVQARNAEELLAGMRQTLGGLPR